ncbi:glycine--tRNA ligase subunit beta [Limnobacter parvus]|uniref:Glycine--tRNA ligase beta subunit n=1 Tax=Limnobacter parvus TaxID=2939690 RepID=A0ABT1XGB7_9BURK|nr:glycine--tRNA ligase subunit beta [Limnobacter parvus]MCR2746336.1 glycine--tRNA ligase subunit beta [Limnobacter parvus]
MNPTLLVELFTEELPPKALKSLGDAFSELLSKTLRDEGHLSDSSVVESFASPRRLACRISDVAALSPEKKIQERLLPVKIGLDANGLPTPPLQKKLESLGLGSIGVDQLETVNDGKQDVLHISRTQAGKALEESLNKALEVATTKLPIPKVMSYQRPDGSTVHFVRPAHRLSCLHGEQVVRAQLLGLESNRITLGHRFLSSGVINITSADTYEEQLEKEGKVIANFNKRKAFIVKALANQAAGDKVIQPEELVDEVCALVEWPVVYEASFEKEFLEVPQECLILTMQANQKYFAITDQHGKMKNRFLLVSNLLTTTPELITTGNERVLRARLADAKFFFDQDRKKTLESRLPGLANVVYHNKLGTQKDRNGRLVELAAALAPVCGADVEQAKRAAQLCKADLLTDMVGEFPELQGNMGEHYAHHDGEHADVAQAIADHYSPRFAGDQLPRNPVGVSTALADKIETMVGIYGIGLIPTGDKDPFALRRHALGVIRMVIEKNLPLDLKEMLAAASLLFTNYPDFKIDLDGLEKFIQDRLRGYLKDQGYSAAEVESVLSQSPSQFADLPKRLEAVRAFSQLPEAQALAAANKRISNILKKTEVASSNVDANLLQVDAEKALAAQVKEVGPHATRAFEQGDYQQALMVLAPLKANVDAFFENVMVMDNNDALKNNRLALLKHMHGLMNRVADISQLAN